VCGLAALAVAAASAAPSARDSCLRDLPRPHRYAPAKNSFLLQHLRPGDRRTLLNIDGAGSVRHIWSTWSIAGDASDTAPPGAAYLQVFVDGEKTPSIAGAIDQLCRAAEATGEKYVPFPAFIYKGAWNTYLPIFFSRGIRIELEARRDMDEFYTQIDYRLTPVAETAARLVSDHGALKYTAAFGPADAPPARTSAATLTGRGPFVIRGPGTLRRLTIRGDNLDQRTLRIWWDGDAQPAVDAPIRYFFADFNNAAIETRPGERTCFFPMPFRGEARIDIDGPASVEYELDKTPPAADEAYFHAAFRDSDRTLGYAQYLALAVRGEGLFVGMNLFDSGHNHGGGDAALIDADSDSPRMLHGICGEDYFSFAWHHTGTMTPLTGAPVHERRYRLHLENPYPFHQSFQFLFGMFAGLHPKSVAFWYQAPAAGEGGEWLAPEIPWQALGPLGAGGGVSIKEPVTLREQWQDAPMRFGFLDVTYLFRHYIYTDSGTGFVPGASHTNLRTFVDSPTARNVPAILGHDDAVVLTMNGKTVATLPAREGFHGSRTELPLRAGWNSLEVTLANEENVDWRWCGLSLAFEKTAARGVRFSTSAGGESDAR